MLLSKQDIKYTSQAASSAISDCCAPCEITTVWTGNWRGYFLRFSRISSRPSVSILKRFWGHPLHGRMIWRSWPFPGVRIFSGTLDIWRGPFWNGSYSQEPMVCSSSRPMQRNFLLRKDSYPWMRSDPPMRLNWSASSLTEWIQRLSSGKRDRSRMRRGSEIGDTSPSSGLDGSNLLKILWKQLEYSKPSARG